MKEVTWSKYSETELNELESLNKGYREFLDNGKTERECVEATVAIAKEHGYVDLNDIIAENKTLKKGDKVYATCMKKAIALFNIGSEKIENGLSILGAHIDCYSWCCG